MQFARQEVESIARLFPASQEVFVGKDATEARFKQDAGRYRVLHLATHGFFNRLNPLFSGVELEPGADEDGQLQVYEILALPLAANLVTLSACDTALGGGELSDLPAGEELIGLTRAFLSRRQQRAGQPLGNRRSEHRGLSRLSTARRARGRFRRRWPRSSASARIAAVPRAIHGTGRPLRSPKAAGRARMTTSRVRRSGKREPHAAKRPAVADSRSAHALCHTGGGNCCRAERVRDGSEPEQRRAGHGLPGSENQRQELRAWGAVGLLQVGTTDPAGVTVRNTQFVSSTEVDATVDVAATASIASFDIRVTNATGRSGKGSDLFNVVQKGGGASQCMLTPLDTTRFQLVRALNQAVNGQPLYQADFGTGLAARRATLIFANGSRDVIMVAVGTRTGKIEVFFVDPTTGALLDGTALVAGGPVQPHVTIVTNVGNQQLAMGDVNHDGILDIVSAEYIGQGSAVRLSIGQRSASGVISYALVTVPPRRSKAPSDLPWPWAISTATGLTRPGHQRRQRRKA